MHIPSSLSVFSRQDFREKFLTGMYIKLQQKSSITHLLLLVPHLDWRVGKSTVVSPVVVDPIWHAHSMKHVCIHC